VRPIFRSARTDQGQVELVSGRVGAVREETHCARLNSRSNWAASGLATMLRQCVQWVPEGIISTCTMVGISGLDQIIV
jgi:hypothetical protein